jgi:hypothetical protein
LRVSVQIDPGVDRIAASGHALFEAAAQQRQRRGLRGLRGLRTNARSRSSRLGLGA